MHQYRGKRWYVLQNHNTGQFRRISPQAYLLVGLMNGQRTIESIWELASERLKDELPTHEEILQFVADLYKGNLIKMDLSGDAAELFRHREEQQRKKWLAKLKSPLSVQIPLFDPNRFLEATERYVAIIFSRQFFALWCVMVTLLGLLAVRHWETLTSNLADQILAADNLVLLWFIYPIIKLLHELGHAYAVKRAGGEVHEVGVMFLVFFPMPYVDASASSGFANKYQRMLVDAAGMMVELFIAAIAMLVWVNAEAGLARSFAFNIVFIAGASTLLFNGNPLLRFDGYFFLADLLELPNLAQRANQYWAYLSKRFLFGLQHLETTADSIREAMIFVVYGAASLVYRLMISITIALFVSQKFFFLGMVLAIWSIVMVWLWPNVKLLWDTLNNQEIIRRGRSPALVLGVLAVLIYLLAFQLPLPQHTTIQGVVATEQNSRILVKESCFVDRWLKQPYDAVSQKEIVVECHNQALSSELAVLLQQHAEAVARRQSTYNDPVKIKIFDEEVADLDKKIVDVRQRIANMPVRSEVDGYVVMSNPADSVGRWYKRGEVVGYVLADGQMTVKAMLPEYMIDLVRDNVVQVIVRTAGDVQQDYIASRWQIFPSASTNVIHPILAVPGGGEIKLDPSAEKQAIERFFHVEVKLDEQFQSPVHQRVYVQFQHASEPVAYRAYRYVRRTFLEYFSV